MATRASRAKAAPVEEPDEDEFEDMEEAEDEPTDGDDLEELEEAEEPEEAPAPKGKRTGSNKGIQAAQKARAESAPEYGSAWLAAHVTEVTGDKYDGRGIRMLLRKLASTGKLDRVVGETRDRYSFSGKNDPIVKLVIQMVTSGEAKALKQAGLDKVKAQAAEKAAAKKAAAAKAAEESADEDEDVEDEDVEEAPAPKPTRTRRAAAKPASTPAKATPAKATTTTRRRASASA